MASPSRNASRGSGPSLSAARGRGASADRVTFEPIENLRAHEYVAEQLRRQIGLHVVPVGGAFPSERELSAMFGVGRATVEAAVRLLEAERLVERRRGRRGGTFVIGHAHDEVATDYLLARLRRNRERVREALLFRRSMDTLAAQLAAVDRTTEEMSEIALAQSHVLETESDAEFMATDTEFHLAIARASHNRFVYDAVEQMRLVLSDAIAALPESTAWRLRTAKEHGLIVDAVRARRAADAAKAMDRHASSTEKSITALLAAL